MWVPINLAKASRLHKSPNVTSIPRVPGEGGTGEDSWLLGWFVTSPRGGEEGEPASSQATPGLAPPRVELSEQLVRSFFQARDRAGLELSPVSRESLEWDLLPGKRSPGQRAPGGRLHGLCAGIIRAFPSFTD